MNRDLDKEKIIDKMRALRDKRDMEILEDSWNKGTNDQEKVLDVRYIGQIDSIGDIYVVIEQLQDKNGNLVQVERYETEDGEVIGGNNKSDHYDFILLSEKYEDRTELLEQLQTLDKNTILDLKEIEKGRLEEVAKELGIEVEEIERVAEIDPEQKMDADKESEQEIDEDKNEKEILSEEEFENVSSKTEIDISQKVTDSETIGSLLKIQNKGYKKIAAVESDKLQDGNSTRFSFVGIKEVRQKDGSKKEVAEKIDTLEQRYGKTPTKQINSLNNDGSKVQEKQVQSIYQIKGDNENQVAINIGSMGTLEVSYIRTPRQDNEAAISIPIETNSIRPTTREVREFMNRQRNTDIMQEMDRIEEHQNADCENLTIKDINDNPYDDTHVHIEMDDAYLDKLTDEILENDEIASVYNREDVKDKIIEYTKEGTENLAKDELVEKVETEMEKDAEAEHELPRNRLGLYKFIQDRRVQQFYKFSLNR